MRAFLDANILFSAAKSDGAIRSLLDLLVKHGWECKADAYVVAEAERNLTSRYPESLSEFNKLLLKLQPCPVVTSSLSDINLSQLPEKDRPVLAAAIFLKCDSLVTGDRTHFGAFFGKVLSGVKIYSPSQLAELLHSSKK